MEISPEYSLEGLMLKLQLQYSGHLMRRTDSLEKTLMLGRIEGRRRGRQRDEMVGWHHRLNGHEFEQALRVGDGQGSLVCCNPWGHKESDLTELLNWTNLGWFCWRKRSQLYWLLDSKYLLWSSLKLSSKLPVSQGKNEGKVIFICFTVCSNAKTKTRFPRGDLYREQ